MGGKEREPGPYCRDREEQPVEKEAYTKDGGQQSPEGGGVWKRASSVSEDGAENTHLKGEQN